jgi:L-ascorbate metabolism protein UlaG (beta-lactamase superfamily)
VSEERTTSTAAQARRERVLRSPQWRDGRFRNALPRVDGPWSRMMFEFFFRGSKFRKPTAPIPYEPRRAADYAAPPASGLRVTWLGHSTALLEIDGRRVLIDPVWAEHVGPVPMYAPKRFYPPPLPLAELPPVDAVLLSHDHYDHLHEATIRALAARGERFLAPLGVGAHLARWGVPEARITECDWWESVALDGLTLAATPARHFSGRRVVDNDRTLWCGWSIAGPAHRVFYAGDTALHTSFAEIGARLGPFDLTLIEAGAYDALWADVHLGPEQAVRAHRLLGGGGVMLPVHWGLFDLALHGWTEPAERVLAAAAADDVRVTIPRPGEMIEPTVHAPAERWWPDVPWKTAAETPVISTGTEYLMDPRTAAQLLPREDSQRIG